MVRAKDIDDGSKVINKSIKQWFRKIDVKQREEVTDIMFEILYSNIDVTFLVAAPLIIGLCYMQQFWIEIHCATSSKKRTLAVFTMRPFGLLPPYIAVRIPLLAYRPSNNPFDLIDRFNA